MAAMENASQSPATRMLIQAREGDRAAADDLFRLVYDELHRLAEQQRGRWVGNHTMNATALVHEAYLKLVGDDFMAAGSRGHFFALASKAMRHILINYAKAQRRQKRGGDAPKLSLDEVLSAGVDAEIELSDERAEHLALLDDALARLEQVSPRQSQVVECRFFGGLSVPETAEALDLSPATVKRDWAVARAWLFREMKGAGL